MLHIRKRGRVWHVRGTVKVGKETREVQEQSTGCRERFAAETYKANLEYEIQQGLLGGPEGRQKRMTLRDAMFTYLNRPGGVHPMDIWRVKELDKILGDYTVAKSREGWGEFKTKRCIGLAPATVDRFRKCLLAAVNYALTESGMDKITLPSIKFKNDRVRYLTKEDQERLLTSYTPHVQPIAMMLCFQGCRTQEALQLRWQNVDPMNERIFFERTKSGEPRSVKMHPRVTIEILMSWTERGKPTSGHVFLNRRGAPYADTREYKLPGGNPLASAHATALRRAKVHPNGGPDFRVHDWRHHWASCCVMAGIDLVTIRQMGGWKSLRMLERYAAVSTQHMDDAMAKLAAEDVSSPEEVEVLDSTDVISKKWA